MNNKLIILSFFQNIDRRILYAIVALVVSVPLVVMPNYHPTKIFDEVKNAYNTIENVPKDKLVFISTIWSGSTQAENGEQTKVIVTHLFKTNRKFVIISWDTSGDKLTYDLVEALSKKYNKTYGEDWVHLGYRLPNLQTMLRGFGTNFNGTFKADRNGTLLKDIPLTKNVKGAKDFGCVVDITPSATLEAWIAYFCEPYKIPLVYCPSAVLAASAYPFLDSKQISGMLNGVIGASQYEVLIGENKKPTNAGAMSLSLSLAHIMILIFIVFGNVAYLIEKRMKSNG